MKKSASSRARSRHTGSAFLLVAVIQSMVACAPDSTSVSTSTEATSADSTASESPELMFVQLAEDLVVDTEANTLRLVNVGQQTLYFSDRPVRIAGHLKMADYLEEWTAQAGPDNFGADPPNATLSVYEEGQPDNTLAVVEITDPQINGADLVYGYTLIDGNLPATGGATSLFIDWVGAGGGVGAGFHGVGVGARGPGRR